MEHIRQFDWCDLLPNNTNFVSEHGLDNCVTEKILQNKFYNPLISSESEDEDDRGKRGRKFDWNQIFKKRNTEVSYHRIFVPGLRPPPGFTRLSTLTATQHLLILKVLCAQNPQILPDEFLPRPTKVDIKAFEDLKETYEKEQQEFIAWAKSLWINGQCIRALRPSPLIENVYEAEFKVRAQQMKGYPTVYEVVAQLPLDATGDFHMELLEDIISVKTSELPLVSYPETIRKRLSVLRPCPVPEPCEQHPFRFILPDERGLTVLPAVEARRELAEYAATRGALLVAGDAALRCLLLRRAWTLPLSVYRVPQDGESTTVLVLGSEFCNKRENAMTRTYRAYRHLLEYSFVPASELSKRMQALREARAPAPASATASAPAPAPSTEDSDDEDNLFIDFGLDEPEPETQQDPEDNEDDSIQSADHKKQTEDSSKKQTEDSSTNQTEQRLDKSYEGFGVYRCTCQDTVFEYPPTRSFRKWQIKNRTTNENFDIIVHSSHKHRGPSGEILLEPILEYQADLGASKLSEDRISSLALSLALRDNASVLNVRIDATSGDVITIEESSHEQFRAQHGDRRADVARAVHSVCNQLLGLVPGHYILQHEANHGENVLLYAARNTGQELQLRLNFDNTQPAEADEAKNVKSAPQLTPTLLPWHKFRKTLPCAFTHYPNQIAQPKKQVQRKKTPPRALKWPKKRNRKQKD